MKRNHIVRRIADIMHQTAPNAQTILYGSEARGDAHPDSDIDLLILVDGSVLTPEHELAMRRPLSELEAQTGVAINAMMLLREVWDSTHTPFTVNVQNEGVVL